MRVCFDTFCFSSRPHATDEEGSVGGVANAVVLVEDAPVAMDLELERKEAKIRELEALLRRRDEEIAGLRSHLDKFQSVLPVYFNPASPKHQVVLNNNILKRRRQRTGISAEPQSEVSLSRQIFPKYEKDQT